MVRDRWMCVLMLLAAAGCAKQIVPERTPRDGTMFGPARMRIHPIFTQVKDWTGDGKPDGIEALIEFQDRFDDPTKAAGRAVFEVFEYRPYNPDPRGERVASPWTGALMTVDEQRARWNRTLSTYSFRLTLPHVSEGRNYVLTASFDRNADQGQPLRFFDRIVIEGHPDTREQEPTVAGDATPTTRPAKP